jgi:hypothetical protein
VSRLRDRMPSYKTFVHRPMCPVYPEQSQDDTSNMYFRAYAAITEDRVSTLDKAYFNRHSVNVTGIRV